MNEILWSTEHYIYLMGDKTLVQGAKYALVIDFATGGLHRLNAPASQILQLSAQGVSVENALQTLNLELNSAESLIADMQAQNLIAVENMPRAIQPEQPVIPPPDLKFIWIEVITECNLRCLHCYAEAPTQAAACPDTKTVCQWMDQAVDMGCRAIQLTGGECTLREDLPNLLAHARRKFDSVEIFTNATLLDNTFIRFLADNQIDVAFSLYSYKPETHDRISGILGSYQRTLENLKLLLAYEVQVRGATIALKQNESELDTTEFFLRELGIATRPADPIRPCGRGRGLKNWPVTYGQRVIRTQPNFFPVRNNFYTNQHWNSCWSGKAGITATGDILPCVFARDLVGGNLYKHSLEWVIHNGLRQYWEITHDTVSVCCDCEYRYICQDCRPWAYGYTGDLHAKTPICTYNPYTGEWGPAEMALKA